MLQQIPSRKEILEIAIDRHDELYWNQNEPEISDIEYDKLVEELRSLDSNNERCNRINTEKVSSKGKIKHLKPMLSQAKVYTADELIRWCIKVSRDSTELFEFSPKYDGCSAELVNNSILSTRGDGEEGDDISDKMRFIDMSLVNDTTYCRGEIVITDQDFINLNTYAALRKMKPYKNQRNSVGGIFSQLTLPEDFPVVLKFIPFNNNVKLISMSSMNQNVIEDYSLMCSMLSVPTDGVIIKVYNVKHHESLGSASHHSKAEIALKFANPTATSKLIDIMWSVGKRRVTPIGLIEPVQINGVTIRKVNLHNMNIINEKGIKIGSTILIERAGDVIPDVRSVVLNPSDITTEITIPNCPECGGHCVFEDPNIVCTNPDCSGRNEMNLLDSVNRIGLENIGKPTIKKIIQMFNCSNLSDLINLTKQDFLKLEGFADTSAENIYNEIQRLKNEPIPEWRLLSSLNIHGIGETMSKTILKDIHPGTLVDIINATHTEELFHTDMMSIPGIGYKRSLELFDGLERHREYLNDIITTLNVVSEIGGSTMTNSKTVCMTGKFDQPKAALKALIESQTNFSVVESVTPELSILISADPSKQSSKQKKAEKLGIPVVSLDQFLREN